MNCLLKNQCNEDIYIAPIQFKVSLKPNKIREIIITIYFPANFNKDKLILLFQFETPSGEIFGESLIGIVDVDYDANPFGDEELDNVEEE